MNSKPPCSSRRWNKPPPSALAARQQFKMSGARRISVPPPVEIFDHRTVLTQIIRADRRFAVAVGNVEHIGRLAQARIAAAQRAHECLAFGDGGAQMRRAGREIGVMQVIGLDAALDQARASARRAFRHRRSRRATAPIARASGCRHRSGARRRRGPVWSIRAGDWRAAPRRSPCSARATRAPMRGVIRSGATAGTRVCTRMTFTWAMAAIFATTCSSRRAESISGSPPVKMTSQICGWPRI